MRQYLVERLAQTKEKTAEAEKFVGKKPQAVIKEEICVKAAKERSVRGRKESAQDLLSLKL